MQLGRQSEAIRGFRLEPAHIVGDRIDLRHDHALVVRESDEGRNWRADQWPSEAIRRNQTQSNAIRGHQTQSDYTIRGAYLAATFA